MASSAVDGLSGVVRGRVVEQGSPDYDEARALYNAMIDKHPCARDEPSRRQALWPAICRQTAIATRKLR